MEHHTPIGKLYALLYCGSRCGLADLLSRGPRRLKAGSENKCVTATLKRCATQNPKQDRGLSAACEVVPSRSPRKKDHKIIAIATEDAEFNAYREGAEMPPHRLLMLRRFFQDYKQLEGKSVEVDEIQPASEAYPIIEDALHRYSEQRRKGFDGHKS
jgi:hypothetical protein